MNLIDLVDALLRGDLLAARQWVKDARRASFRYEAVARPAGLGQTALSVAAGLVELLASREGQSAPAWTAQVGPAPEDHWLDPGLATIPVLRERCLKSGPEPLRKRHLHALPGFLEVA